MSFELPAIFTKKVPAETSEQKEGSLRQAATGMLAGALREGRMLDRDFIERTADSIYETQLAQAGASSSKDRVPYRRLSEDEQEHFQAYAERAVGEYIQGEKETYGDSIHYKARLEIPADYPPNTEKYPRRFSVPSEKTSWDVPFDRYAPEDFIHSSVLKDAKTGERPVWAEPNAIVELPVGREFQSYEGEVRKDEQGRPMNPKGRTGIEGKGLLGKWGANFAADNIITRDSEDGAGAEVFLIQRKDGTWGFPAGMVDAGETASIAAVREFKEETGFDLDLAGATEVYKGYVDDPRNTDNAWMETTAMRKHYSREEAAQFKSHNDANEEVRKVRWMKVTPELFDKMYASHASMLEMALGK
jgi:ADP-ribose pyrophosphatase